MKAITLTQPWATLVAIGETRSWPTRYRGPLAIHAAKGLAGMTERDLAVLCDSEPFFTVLRPHLSGYTAAERARDLPRGRIVATTRLVDCIHSETVTLMLAAQERAFGNFDRGRYAWLLERVLNLNDGIECRGALGLWDVPDDVLAQLAAVDTVTDE